MHGIHLARFCAAGLGIILIAGCANSPATVHATAVASPSPSASAPLGAQLSTVVLQSTDLPTGWQGLPYKADPATAANNAAMAKCVGGRNTDTDKVGDAHSKGFVLGNASISSSASSYRSQSDIASDVAALQNPKVSLCYEKLLKAEAAKSLPAGAAILSASIHIAAGSAGGPANLSATGIGTVNVTVNGQQVTMYVSIAFITGPMMEAEVDTFSVGTPVPAPLVKSLTVSVATRAAQKHPGTAV